MNDATFTLEMKGLEHLIQMMKARPPELRIGVLNGGGRSPSNALIGAVHEFGSPSRNIPARSFLREPLSEHLKTQVERDGLLNKDVLAKVVKTGSVIPWLKEIALSAEKVVDQAFDTGGFGKWAPWKDPGYKNATGKLLIDTGQLKDSISSEVSS